MLDSTCRRDLAPAAGARDRRRVGPLISILRPRAWIAGAATVLMLVVSSPAAELKVATVDLQRLLKEYQRAQEVARELERKQRTFLAELDGLRLEGRKLAEETEQLQELTTSNILSATERDAKKKLFENKLYDLRAFEMKYDDVRARREAELRQQMAQANKAVLDDILTTTKGFGERYGFHLILNRNSANPVASDVLFARGIEDITDQILLSLHRRPVTPEK